MKLVSTIVVAAAAIVLTGAALLAQSGSDLFARALVEEKTGSYEEAIALYQAIVEKHGSDKTLAARALWQMGQAYEKFGRPADARRAYDRIARELADQQAIAADARQRLAALTGPAPVDSPHRLVCSSCGEYGPSSLIADGRLLVFDRDGDLWVRDTVSREEKPLLTDPSDAARFPLLSPDGKSIAYVRLWDPDGHDLRVVANEAGATPRILNDNPQYYRLIPAAWEPGGRSILAVAHMTVDDTWMLARVSTSDGTVTHLRSLSWRFHILDSLGPPRLSPDGRRVAYAASVSDRPPAGPRPTALDDSHIYLLSLDGSTPEIALVKGASRNESPVWTPDGRHLLFVSNRGLDWGVWSVDVESGALQQIRGLAGRVESLGVTSSGSYVYRRPPPAGNRTRPSFAVSARTPQSGVASRRGPETVFGREPTWSPDGRHIAFLRDEEIAGQTTLRSSPFVHSIETGNEQRYVVPGGSVMGLWWLNDSRGLLVWTGDRNRMNEIYRVDLGNGNVTRVAPAARFTRILPSADRQTLFASVSDTDYEGGGRVACETLELGAVDVSTGNWRPVASVSMPRGGDWSLSVSADERTLFVLPCSRVERRESGSETAYFRRVVAVDVMTGEQRDVLVLPDTQWIGQVRLAPDGRTLAVLVTGSQPARQTVVRVGVDGTGDRELHVYVHRNGGYISNDSLSWTADGAAIRWCEAVSLNAACRPVEIDAEGRGGVREAPAPDRGVQSPDGLHVITIAPNRGTLRGLWETWAMDNVTSVLSRAPR